MEAAVEATTLMVLGHRTAPVAVEALENVATTDLELAQIQAEVVEV
jgi:hypothetical protein